MPGPSPDSSAFSQSVLLLVYAFTGFEMATIPAGEVRDPQRNLPRALLIAILVVAVLYILIQIVCVGTLPGLGQSTEAARRRRYTVSRHSRRRDHFRWRDHFDYGQPEHPDAFRLATSVCDGGTEAVAGVYRQYSPIVFHALRSNSDHRGLDAFPDVEKLVRGSVNYQHDCATGDLCRDVPLLAGVSPPRAT